MERENREEIIILDAGLDDSPDGITACCFLAYTLFKS